MEDTPWTSDRLPLFRQHPAAHGGLKFSPPPLCQALDCSLNRALDRAPPEVWLSRPRS